MRPARLFTAAPVLVCAAVALSAFMTMGTGTGSVSPSKGGRSVDAASPPSAEHFDRRAEHIPCAALGPDVLRLGRVRLDLAPQPEDLHVDRTIVNLSTMQPRKIEQLLARQHPLRRGAKRLQQVELAMGKLDPAALRRGQPAAAEVELPAGKAVSAPLVAARRKHRARRLIATQHCADAGEELARAEWLGDIVVGAELEAHHAVGLVLLAGDDDDRDRRM